MPRSNKKKDEHKEREEEAAEKLLAGEFHYC